MPSCLGPTIVVQKVEVLIIATGFSEDFVGGSDDIYLSVGWDCTRDPCTIPNPSETCENEEFTYPSGTVSVEGIFVEEVRTCDGTFLVNNSANVVDGFGHDFAIKALNDAFNAAGCTDDSEQDNNTLANIMTPQDFIQKAKAFAEGGNFADYYSDCDDADLTSTTEDDGNFNSTFTLTQFKFRKPTSENYTYYKCIYDIYSFYSDRTEEFLKDQEVVFTGNESDFIELAPPPEEGSRQVVNIRFECYRSPDYGNKPQRIGEKVVPSSFSPPP